MLLTRVISALLLLPFALWLFIGGPSWLVLMFLVLCAGLCVYEMAKMSLPTLERRMAGLAAQAQVQTPSMLNVAEDGATRYLPYLAVTIAVVLLLTTAFSSPAAILGLIVLGLFAALLVGEGLSSSIDQAAARAFGILISICYGALPWLVIWQLYKMSDHAKYVLLVMAVTWCGDTGAYFGGRFFGGKLFKGRKLAPTISPKKTWEGAVAGLAFSVVGALVLDLVCRSTGLGAVASTGALILAGLLGGVFEQLGDLLESLFKRFAGVKDSGTLIPGHGGFLDRVDGILFAAPVIWSVLYFSQTG